MSGEPSDHVAPALGWTTVVIIVGMVSASTILSQFFRASTAVLGPELIGELSLSSEGLAFANGAFFMGLFLAQMPVGMAFDRFGPRLTMAVLSVPMAAGAMLHSMVESGQGLALVRFLVGIGCGGGYTAGIVVISRWFPRPSWSTVVSWQFALGQIGLVLAGTPLAAATVLVGWRFPFIVMGLVAMLVGYLYLSLVRDAPPGAPYAMQETAAKTGAIQGLSEILSTPGLVRVLCLFMVAFSSLVTVMVLWAGPYLHDIYGLDAIERGHVLLAMAVTQTAGVLIVGPLDRIFNTRKWVAVASALLALLSLSALALLRLSLTETVCCLMLLSAASAYGGLLFAHIRSLFPDHLAGRSTTIGNMAPMLGAALLPTLTGFIPPLFPHAGPGYAPEAYRCIFATLAILLAAGLAVYLTVNDAKPVPRTSPST